MSHVRFEAKYQKLAIALSLGSLLAAALHACGNEQLPPPWTPPGQLKIAYVSPEYSDPISAPLEPTLDASKFWGSAGCLGCHTAHAEEWKHSMHANAMHDRVFQGLVQLQRVQRKTAGFDGYCVQCHSPIALRGGLIPTGFDFADLQTVPVAMEGITCEVCHRASSVERSHSSGLLIVHDGVLRGPLEHTAGAHETEKSALFEDAKLCASCHDVRADDGLTKLESPYEEWLKSPAAREGRTCQSCHMPTYRGKTAPGAMTSPERPNLHRHNFSAIEPITEGAACSEPGHLCAAAKIDAALSSSEDEGCQLTVNITNLVDGHRFPTGSIFFRQTWLAVEVHDANGKLIFESGQLDDQHDLHDKHDPDADVLDPQLAVLHGYLRDENDHVTLFPWRSTRVDSHALQIGEVRAVVYQLPETSAVLPLRASVTLRFRPFSPRLLRTIGEDSQIETLHVTDVAHARATLEGG